MRFSLNEPVVVIDNCGREPNYYPATVIKIGSRYVTVSRGGNSPELRFDGETGEYANLDFVNFFKLFSRADIANLEAREKLLAVLEGAKVEVQKGKLSTERMIALADVINGALR